MDPVFAVFWCAIALLLGFGVSYILLGWHRGAALAVLTLFVALGVGLPLPGGIAVGLAFVATLGAVGVGAGQNTSAALVMFTTALAVTAFANASHTQPGAFALLALFTAVGTGWGADSWRRARSMALSD